MLQNYNFECTLPLTLLYCHHFWQPKNFFFTQFFFQFSSSFQCSFIVSFPKKSFPNENRSRRWRKKSLSRVSSLQKVNTILTGHTQTDRVENILTNIVRGTTAKSFQILSKFHSKKKDTFFFSSLCEEIFYLGNFSISDFKKLRFLSVNPSFVVQRVFFDREQNIKTKVRALVFKGVPYRSQIWNKFGSRLSRAQTQRRHNKLLVSFCDTQGANSKLENLEEHLSFCFAKTQGKENVAKEKKYFERESRFSFFQQTSCFSRSQIWNKFGSNSIILRQKFLFFGSNSFSFYRFSELQWWKPLRIVQRNAVSKLLNFYQLPVFIDLSNFYCQFSRNKIRHRFFPFLKSLFHGKIELLFEQCFQTLGENYQFLKVKLAEISLIVFLFQKLKFEALPQNDMSIYSQIWNKFGTGQGLSLSLRLKLEDEERSHFSFLKLKAGTHLSLRENLKLTESNFLSKNQWLMLEWFFGSFSENLQALFIHELLFIYKDVEGTFSQILCLKNQIFNKKK